MTNLKHARFLLKYSPFFLVFLFVWLSRILWIGLYGVDVPFWDQWDAQASDLFLPIVRGDFKVSRLFAQHNEHRIFFTRIFSISLFKILGYWNTVFEMQVQSMIPAITAGLISYWFSLKRSSLFISVGIAFYFAAPLGTENLFLGMESNFYFMILFSLLAIVSYSKIEEGYFYFFLTLFFSISAYFTLSSGAIVSMVITFFCILKLVLKQGRSSKANILVSILFLIIFLIEILTIVPVPGHQGLRANRPDTFFRGLQIYLAWPFFKSISLGFLFHVVGLSSLVYIVFKKKEKLKEPAFLSFFAFLVWIYAQILVLVYARGGDGNSTDIANRYLDILYLTPIFLFYIVLSFIETRVNRIKYVEYGFAILCFIFFFRIAKDGHLERVRLQLEKEHMLAVIVKAKQMEINKSGSSLVYLQARTPAVDLPYPDPKRLHMLLTDPNFDRIYPKLRLLYRKD
jgi:hypothetical protein